MSECVSVKSRGSGRPKLQHATARAINGRTCARTYQAFERRVCGQKRALQHVKIDSLVLGNGRVVAEAKVDDDQAPAEGGGSRSAAAAVCAAAGLWCAVASLLLLLLLTVVACLLLPACG